MSASRAAASLSRALLLSALLIAAWVAAAAAQTAAPLGFRMESVQGGMRSLESERGRRAVVGFYEDRDHIEDNAAFKGEIVQLLRQAHRERPVTVWGIADLSGVDVPREFVRLFIRELVGDAGVDVLLDWEGVLRRPPFSFDRGASTVFLVNRAGALVFTHAGPMTADSRRGFFRALRRALRE